jgi:hypothetical protein
MEHQYRYHFDHILLNKKTEQAIIFFWSFKNTTKKATEALEHTKLMFQEVL